jgi:hypothetical protein
MESTRWRPFLNDNLRSSEQLNHWIANGDIQPLESLFLLGRSDILMSSEYKENFIYGHTRSKQFLNDLPEYKVLIFLCLKNYFIFNNLG